MTPPPPGNAISSGLVITLGADFSPSRGLPAGVMATGVLGFAAAGVFAVVLPRLRHRRN